MGIQESNASQNQIITGLRAGTLRAKNTGVCVEQSYSGVKLHLGSGNCYWDGWVNIDLESPSSDVKCDLAKIDFPENHADVAVAIHVIEHFYEWTVVDILKKWHKVLKPGGQLILELPCMDKVFNYIRDCMTEGESINPSFSWWALYGDPNYESVPMTHKWGYTEQMIKAKLLQAGFADVAFRDALYHYPMRDMRVVATK